MMTNDDTKNAEKCRDLEGIITVTENGLDWN
jgi:hypothetical protein